MSWLVFVLAYFTKHLHLYMCLHNHPGERNDWVAALQDCTRGRPLRSTMIPGSPLASTTIHGSPPALEFQGNLELRGLRSKLYTVVALDKVFLYKNIEVRALCACL